MKHLKGQQHLWETQSSCISFSSSTSPGICKGEENLMVSHHLCQSNHYQALQSRKVQLTTSCKPHISKRLPKLQSYKLIPLPSICIALPMLTSPKPHGEEVICPNRIHKAAKQEKAYIILPNTCGDLDAQTLNSTGQLLPPSSGLLRVEESSRPCTLTSCAKS